MRNAPLRVVMNDAAALANINILSKFLYLHRVLPVKTGAAQRQTGYNGRQIFHPQISKRICADNPADFFYRMRGSHKLTVRRHIRTEITGV